MEQVSRPGFGKVYDVCPVTCATFGFGPCTTKYMKIDPNV